MSKKAVRLSEVIQGPSEIETDKPHFYHMYTGKLSEYYYRRFDQAIRLADLSTSERILQIGGGTGVFTLTLVKYCDDIHFTDLKTYDNFRVSQQLLEYVEYDGEVHYASTDASSLAYEKDTFDKIFAMDVLEHIPQEKEAIKEISRVIKPDGKVIVSAPIEIGIPLLIRESYRTLSEIRGDIDEPRRNTKSISELINGILKNPQIDQGGSHRGYDYRTTKKYLGEEFDSVFVEFCPIKPLKELNLTSIIVGKNSTHH